MGLRPLHPGYVRVLRNRGDSMMGYIYAHIRCPHVYIVFTQPHGLLDPSKSHIPNLRPNLGHGRLESARIWKGKMAAEGQDSSVTLARKGLRVLGA